MLRFKKEHMSLDSAGNLTFVKSIMLCWDS